MAVEWSAKHIFEWRDALNKNNPSTLTLGDNNSRNKWQPPTEGQVKPLTDGQVKINVDASVFTGANFFL